MSSTEWNLFVLLCRKSVVVLAKLITVRRYARVNFTSPKLSINFTCEIQSICSTFVCYISLAKLNKLLNNENGNQETTPTISQFSELEDSWCFRINTVTVV